MTPNNWVDVVFSPGWPVGFYSEVSSSTVVQIVRSVSRHASSLDGAPLKDEE